MSTSQRLRPTKIRCRSCGAQIVWARTEDGKRMPVDAEPVSDGNMLLVETAGGKLLAFVKRWFIDHGYDYGWNLNGNPLEGTEWFGRYVSHFANCEQAASWRKR